MGEKRRRAVLERARRREKRLFIYKGSGDTRRYRARRICFIRCNNRVAARAGPAITLACQSAPPSRRCWFERILFIFILPPSPVSTIPRVRLPWIFRQKSHTVPAHTRTHRDTLRPFVSALARRTVRFHSRKFTIIKRKLFPRVFLFFSRRRNKTTRAIKRNSTIRKHTYNPMRAPVCTYFRSSGFCLSPLLFVPFTSHFLFFFLCPFRFSRFSVFYSAVFVF